MLGVELLVAEHHHRGDGVEHRHRQDADRQGDEQGGRQELPHRNAGGTGDDELLRARQPQERVHPAEQCRERQQRLCQEGQAQQRHLEHLDQPDALASLDPAQQLDDIDDEGEGDQDRQRQRDAGQKLAAEIGQEGHGQAHQAVPVSTLRGADPWRRAARR